MTRRSARIGACALVAVALAGWLLACGSSGGDTLQPGPRRLMLRDVTGLVIVPTYERLVAAAEQQVAAVDQLDRTTDGMSLGAAQLAWRQARAVWKQSEAFAIGPVETLRTSSKIDWSPVRPDRIETEIKGSGELTADYVEDLGANVKGFLAIEYLLFDPNGDDAVLAALTAAPRRRQFLRALAENLCDQAAVLRDAWTVGPDEFGAVLGNPNAANPVFPTVKSAVDKLVNQLIFLSEDIADTQLLAALGMRDGGPPRPDALAAHRSQNGLADLLDELAGIQNVYFSAYAGRRGTSLADIVEAVDPQTANSLSLTMHRALETASTIPPPLEESVVTDAPAVQRAQVRAKELMHGLEIDLITVLGTTLRFNPNDGD